MTVWNERRSMKLVSVVQLLASLEMLLLLSSFACIVTLPPRTHAMRITPTTSISSLRVHFPKILTTRGGSSASSSSSGVVSGGAAVKREWLEPQGNQMTVALSPPPPPASTGLSTASATSTNAAATIGIASSALTPTLSNSDRVPLLSNSTTKLTMKNGFMLTIGAILLILAYKERSVWLPLLNKQKIQDTTLQILHSLVPENKQDQWKALALYSLGMACWEFLGLSTIPVETAAGMVFGWQAAYASVGGKLLGAGIAFYSGRTFLFRFAQAKLMTNPVFVLLNSSADVDATTASHDDDTNADMTNNNKQQKKKKIPPLATAFLMKYSCFPEFIKNFGSSLLVVIQPWMFFLATFVHGGMFTLLWTWLGKDAAMGLEHAGGVDSTLLPADIGLRVALITAGFVGVVVTPLLMAWWIRELRRQSMPSDTTTTATPAVATSNT